MALSLKELRNKMVPPSAKKDSEIDKQWLEPGSYDEKMVKAMKGEKEEVYDQHDEKHQADNFTAQNMVKKNAKAPLQEIEEFPVASSPTSSQVNVAYEEEALDLLEDILDIIDDIDTDAGYYWKDITHHLKSVRDCLLNNVVNESVEYIEESFKAGTLKLKDGSKVKLTKEDVHVLNIAVAGTSNQTKLIGEVTKDKTEFNHFLTFAKNLKEDYDLALENILSEADESQLEYIVDNELSEGEVWNYVKGGAGVGASVGKNVGAAIGMTGGAVYGGAIGGTIGVAKNAHKMSRLVKKWNKKKSLEEENNESESILGTSEPALDSDKKKTKEDLQEVSKELLKRYIKTASKAAVGTAAAIGGIEGNPHSDRIAKNYSRALTKKVSNRMKGIDMAADKLVKEDETIEEISKEKTEKYLNKAIEDHGMSNFARKSTEGQPGKESAYKYWKRRTDNRKKGISKAIDKLNESGGLGGHPINYRNPAEGPVKFAKTEPGKKLKEYVITPHDVVGKMPKKEGDVFTVKYDRNTTVQMELIRIVDNRLYAKPAKKD